MENKKTVITIESDVKAPVAKVWELWNGPEHIIKWNSASEDWHTPRAENDLKVGGSFLSRMEARDGSMGFDFMGTYDVVEPFEKMEYTLGDGRKVKITFTDARDTTHIKEEFEAEDMNAVELQQQGWQAILDAFRQYAENN